MWPEVGRWKQKVGQAREGRSRMSKPVRLNRPVLGREINMTEKLIK